MKRCRTCNRKYTDETAEYCLDDGTPLSGACDVDATLDLTDPFDLDATIHIDDSGNETSDAICYISVLVKSGYNALRGGS